MEVKIEKKLHEENVSFYQMKMFFYKHYNLLAKNIVKKQFNINDEEILNNFIQNIQNEIELYFGNKDDNCIANQDVIKERLKPKNNIELWSNNAYKETKNLTLPENIFELYVVLDNLNYIYIKAFTTIIYKQAIEFGHTQYEASQYAFWARNLFEQELLKYGLLKFQE